MLFVVSPNVVCRPAAPRAQAKRGAGRGPFHSLLADTRMRSNTLEDRGSSNLVLLAVIGRLGEHDPDLPACRLPARPRKRSVQSERLLPAPAPRRRSRDSLDVLAHVEFQRPGLLDGGVGADARDLEQPQCVHPRRQTDWQHPARFRTRIAQRPTMVWRAGARVKIRFGPGNDVSDPADALPG